MKYKLKLQTKTMKSNDNSIPLSLGGLGWCCVSGTWAAWGLKAGVWWVGGGSWGGSASRWASLEPELLVLWGWEHNLRIHSSHLRAQPSYKEQSALGTGKGFQSEIVFKTPNYWFLISPVLVGVPSPQYQIPSTSQGAQGLGFVWGVMVKGKEVRRHTPWHILP